MASKGRTATLGAWNPQRIRELREAKGLNPTKLAALCDVTADAVKKWEAGENEPRASNLIALLNALDCSLGDLTA